MKSWSNFWIVANSISDQNFCWKFILTLTWWWIKLIWWCDSKCRFFSKFYSKRILRSFFRFRARWFRKNWCFWNKWNFSCRAMRFSSKKKINKHFARSFRKKTVDSSIFLRNGMIDLYEIDRLLIQTVSFHIFWKIFVAFFICLRWMVFRIVLMTCFLCVLIFFQFFWVCRKSFFRTINCWKVFRARFARVRAARHFSSKFEMIRDKTMNLRMNRKMTLTMILFKNKMKMFSFSQIDVFSIEIFEIFENFCFKIFSNFVWSSWFQLYRSKKKQKSMKKSNVISISMWLKLWFSSKRVLQIKIRIVNFFVDRHKSIMNFEPWKWK